MSCHSQIWTNSPLLEPLRKAYAEGRPIEWSKVNKVPEFVYFDHSIHVQKGISCSQCHGEVVDMNITWKGKPFFMSWCLECHREPEKFLYKDPEMADLPPREQIFELYRKYQRGDKLTPREYNLLHGHDHDPSKKEIEEGQAIIKERKIVVDQLEDCYICHR